MCGITGWYNRNGAPVDGRVLQHMNNALQHRGPDGEGCWIQGSIGLAHRRLAIRDLSENGRQPMLDPSGRVVVTYNGEIYNDQELRKMLSRDFGYNSIPPAIRKCCLTPIWRGANVCSNALKACTLSGCGIGNSNGCFSARSGGHQAVVFCGDVRRRSVRQRSQGDPDAWRGAVAIRPASPAHNLAAGHAGTAAATLVGVEQVEPGMSVTFSAAQRSANRFWMPHRQGDIADSELAIERLSAALDDVVGSQLVSDVPLGVLQSGGIDSTLVSLTVAKQGATPPLFTASFDDRSFDETELARRVAAVVGLPQRIVPIAATANVEAAFRAVSHHFDGQCADTGSLAYYRLAEAVRRHTKVVLSGDGGDEFFCGYETYAATRAAEVLRHVVPAAVARWVGQFAYRCNATDERRLPMTALLSRFALGLADGGSRPHLEWRRLVPQFVAREIYGSEMADLVCASPYAEYASYYDNASGDVLDRAIIADQRFHLQSILAKVDAMSMAHGLEVRVPLRRAGR